MPSSASASAGEPAGDVLAAPDRGAQDDVERRALVGAAQRDREPVEHEVAAGERRDQAEQLPGEVALRGCVKLCALNPNASLSASG